MVSQQYVARAPTGRLAEPAQGEPVELVGWFSWRAILSGAFLTLALLTVSGLLARGCGLDFTYRSAPSTGQMVGAVIWGLIAAFVCFGLGGMLTGWGVARPAALANGLVVWAIVTTLGAAALGAVVGPMLSRVPGPLVNTDHLQSAAWWTLLSLCVGLIGALWGAAAGSRRSGVV